MIQVGHDGEWPLFLDVWFEHVVEEVATADREGSKGTIEGPYYVPDAPSCRAECTLRDAGRRARHAAALPGPGAAPSTATPLAGALVDIWHADDRRLLLPVRARPPATGTCAAAWSPTTRAASRSTTIQPAPYQIPTDGSCGALIAAAGWHAWRPAHLHLKVSAPGH